MNASSDIYTKLKDDHASVASTLQRLVQTSARDTGKRQALFTELKHSLTQHSEAENQVFYSALLQHDATRRLIRDGQQEHQHIETQLDELDRMDKNSPQWNARLRALQETIEHHVHEEENQLFAKARTILSPKQAEEMGQQLTQAKARQGRSKATESAAKAQEAGTQVYEGARRLAGEAKQQGQSILQQQQGFVASQIESIAGALHKTAEQLGSDEQGALAQYTEQAAAGLERFSHSIRDQDFNTVVRQVEDFARRQPTVFIGSAALLGFLAARFLKSSAERSHAPRRHSAYADPAVTSPAATPSPVPDPTLEATGGGARRTTTVPGGK